MCVLTAPGTAPVTVLALRGDVRALPLADAAGHAVAWPREGRLRRVLIPDEDGATLDEALAVSCRDGAELHLHGGEAVRTTILARLVRAGFRERLVASAPPPACWREARALLSSRHGPMAVLVGQAAEALERGWLDEPLRARVARACALSCFADALRRPPVVRLVGVPNAGKSTLFNALLGSERALTSPVAGTTRDTVRAMWSLHGVPVALEDTAGGEGADRSPADLVVEVLERPGVRGRHPEGLQVLGRADLHAVDHPWRVSCRTGEGLDRLRAGLAGRLELPASIDADLLAPIDMSQRVVLDAVRASPGHPPGAAPPSR